MKKIGKRAKEWAEAKKKLKRIFRDRGIMRCENCGSEFALSFHHRYPRNHYYKKPELLGDFKESLLLCCSCHSELQRDNKLSEELFNKLR